MKKFIYTITFLLIGSLSANAYIDSQHMTSEQSLINQGYSKDTAVVIKAANKNPYDAIEEKTDNRTIYQKIYNYLDPCSEVNRAYPNHDFKPNSNWQDL